MEARYVRNPCKTGNDLTEIRAMADAIMGWDVDLHCEWPQVYRAGKSKGDPNDLLILTAILGALSARFNGTLTSYLPREWKGTLDPDICIERIQGRLTGEETSRVDLAGAKSHNIWDAVGIGLHAVGRGVMQRRRVIAR